MSDDNLVYSTGIGRISPKSKLPTPPKGDGIVRIHKQTKGRKGKGVSIISGLDLSVSELKILCKELKKKCGTGGSVKEFSIEIQGDVREQLKDELQKRGHIVKLAGS